MKLKLILTSFVVSLLFFHASALGQARAVEGFAGLSARDGFGWHLDGQDFVDTIGGFSLKAGEGWVLEPLNQAKPEIFRPRLRLSSQGQKLTIEIAGMRFLRERQHPQTIIGRVQKNLFGEFVKNVALNCAVSGRNLSIYPHPAKVTESLGVLTWANSLFFFRIVDAGDAKSLQGRLTAALVGFKRISPMRLMQIQKNFLDAPQHRCHITAQTALRFGVSYDFGLGFNWTRPSGSAWQEFFANEAKDVDPRASFAIVDTSLDMVGVLIDDKTQTGNMAGRDYHFLARQKYSPGTDAPHRKAPELREFKSLGIVTFASQLAPKNGRARRLLTLHFPDDKGDSNRRYLCFIIHAPLEILSYAANQADQCFAALRAAFRQPYGIATQGDVRYDIRFGYAIRGAVEVINLSAQRGLDPVVNQLVEIKAGESSLVLWSLYEAESLSAIQELLDRALPIFEIKAKADANKLKLNPTKLGKQAAYTLDLPTKAGLKRLYVVDRGRRRFLALFRGDQKALAKIQEALGFD